MGLPVPAVVGDTLATQQVLLHLRRGRFRQLGQDAEVARHHEIGHVVGEEGEQRRRVDACPSTGATATMTSSSPTSLGTP